MERSPVAAVAKMVEDMQQNLHTCIPGKIESFDADKCLAVVTPTGQFKTPAGKLLDYPKVSDVPVWVMQCSGQKITIAHPIKQGDECLLFFSEQQLDKFRDGEDAKCDLRFDLTNAIALVGLFAQANSIVKEACDEDSVIIDHNDDSRVILKKDEQVYKVGDDSTCTIKAGEQECKVGSATFTIKDGEITAKASKIKMDGDLEVTGKVTAQQTIDATGSITSTTGNISATAGSVSDAVNDVTNHAHNCTAPGTPSGPAMPIS